MTKPAAAAVLGTSLNNKVVHVFDYGKTRDYRTVSPPASITLFLYDNSLQILEHSSNYMYAYAERKQLFTISLMVLVVEWSQWKYQTATPIFLKVVASLYTK